MKLIESRMVFATALVLSCFVGVLALSGCSSSDKERISDLVESTLSVTQMEQDEFLSDTAESLSDYGLTTDEVLDAYFHDYEFNIIEVSIEGRTATVNCDISIIAPDEFLDIFTTKATEYASSDDVQGLTEEEINLQLGKLLIDSMNETDTRTTNLD
ncbi:MAG: hypothetical protein HGA54_02120, partial [Actinobacteria bacterium]|nr:hypothetical protein [Actinomycetota bacterium]